MISKFVESKLVVGVCIVKNLAVRCVSRYRDIYTIYRVILQYHGHDNV